MMSLGGVVILGFIFIACTYAAPESRSLDDSATTFIESNEEKYTKQLDDVVDDIMKKIAANDTIGAEKSFSDFVAKAESRLSHSTVSNEASKEDAKTKEIANVLKHVLKKMNEGKGAEKKIKDILETAAKTGKLDRGFVSDLINSTLSGVGLGLSLGNNNGTTNQLCVKLGTIMSGCRRIGAAKETSNDHNKTITDPIEDAGLSRTRGEEYIRRLRYGGRRDLISLILSVILDLFDRIRGSES